MAGHLGQLSHYTDNDDVNNRVTLHTYSPPGTMAICLTAHDDLKLLLLTLYLHFSFKHIKSLCLCAAHVKYLTNNINDPQPQLISMNND